MKREPWQYHAISETMKRRYDQGGSWDRDSGAPKQHKADTSWDEGQSQLAMKLLFPLAEARVIQGKDDETLRLLQKLTGTQVKLSSDEEMYPGTEMRELTLRGATVEAVHNAAVLALSQISSLSGSGGSVKVAAIELPSDGIVPRTAHE